MLASDWLPQVGVQRRKYQPMIGRLFLTLLLAGGMASAATITANVDWSRGQALWMNENGAPVNAYFAGVLSITLNDNGVNYYRDTLCVDLFTDIYVGVSYGTVVKHPYQIPGRNLLRVSWLVDNALLPTEHDPGIVSALDPADWVTTAAQGAAIQFAIWDIVEDGGDGFDSGKVSVSTDPLHPTDADVLKWAKFYEEASAGNTSDLAFVYVNSSLGYNTPVGTPAQMLAGPRFLYDSGPQPNPEPSTWAFCVMGLIAVLWLRFQNRPALLSARYQRSGTAD